MAGEQVKRFSALLVIRETQIKPTVRYCFIIFIYLAVSGLHCSMQASLWLRCMGPVVATHRPSCPEARGILVPRPGIKPVSPG